MKYSTKAALLEDMEVEFDALAAFLDRIPSLRYTEGGVWGDDWTVLDLVAHLAEWQAMFLGWHTTGLSGGTPEMPAPGYRWNQTPALNRAIQQKHRDRGYDEVWSEFSTTYRTVLDLARSLSEAELLEAGHFEWTGRNALVTYLGANTASHYRFAQKVLKRWVKNRPEVLEKP